MKEKTKMLSPGSRKILLILFTGFAVLALAYHCAGLFYPVDGSPVWRHFLFALIAVLCIYGIIKCPPYFTLFVFLLLIQQYYSHGSYLIQLWKEQHKIHWISILILAGMPLLLIWTIEERRERKNGSRKRQL